MANKKKILPTTLYVKMEKDWFNAEEDPSELAEGGKHVEVGVYVLREVKKLTTKTVLE